MTVPSDASVAPFHLARTLRTALSAARGRLLFLFVVSAITVGAPEALSNWFRQNYAPISRAILGPSPSLPAWLVIGAPATLVFAPAQLVVVGWMNRVLLMAMAGQPGDLGRDFRYSASRIARLCLLSLALAAGVTLFTLLFVIPGVVFATAACLSVPAMMAEDLRPMEAIDRSALLTQGVRWWLFGLGAISGLGAVVVTDVTAILSAPHGAHLSAALSSAPALYLVRPLVAVVSQVVGVAFLTAAYYELAAGKA